MFIDNDQLPAQQLPSHPLVPPTCQIKSCEMHAMKELTSLKKKNVLKQIVLYSPKVCFSFLKEIFMLSHVLFIETWSIYKAYISDECIGWAEIYYHYYLYYWYNMK